MTRHHRYVQYSETDARAFTMLGRRSEKDVFVAASQWVDNETCFCYEDTRDSSKDFELDYYAGPWGEGLPEEPDWFR